MYIPSAHGFGMISRARSLSQYVKARQMSVCVSLEAIDVDKHMAHARATASLSEQTYATPGRNACQYSLWWLDSKRSRNEITVGSPDANLAAVPGWLRGILGSCSHRGHDALKQNDDRPEASVLGKFANDDP